MNRWITLMQERFPILWIALLVAGIALSGIALGQGAMKPLPLILSFIGIAFYFALMWLIVEVRDVEKEKIIHPNRPLARGLISKKEAIQIIDILLILFIAYAFIIWPVLHAPAAIAFLAIVLYLWLAHKGFYLGSKLDRHPLLKGVLYQMGIFPVVCYAVAVANPSLAISEQSWTFAVFLFAAFSCYDICTKLNPHAHPVLGTYVHFFGFRRVYYFVAFLLIIAAMNAITLNVAWIAIPVELLVLSAVSVLFFQPSLYRIPDLISGVSVMVHAWAIALKYFFS